MYKAVFSFILLATFSVFNCQAQQPSLWFSKNYEPPSHYFSSLDYVKTPIAFDSVKSVFNGQQDSISDFYPSDGPSRVGGHHLYINAFSVEKNSSWVLDLTISSYVANFWFTIFDENGQLIGEFEGGVSSEITNPYFLRHGRNIDLEPGDYFLVAELVSPFYISAPIPKPIPKSLYEQEIKLTNWVTGVGLGVFFGLGTYYLVMSFIRRNRLDYIYSMFIWSNFIFNMSSLLVLSDVFQVSWFYFSSATIAISNMLYMLFVMRLLKVHKRRNRGLYYSGFGIVSVMGLLMINAYFIHPEYSNISNTIGVLMFCLYGFIAALMKSFSGENRMNARLYLLANIGFMGPAIIATVTPNAWSVDTTYASHWGLMAVAIEVILLSFLISYQLNQVHAERDVALKQARKSLHLASTDRLTGIPNRYAMERYLNATDSDIGFTFIDLDGLKMYNDNHGHSMGDELLKSFSLVLNQNLPDSLKLFRIAGDEFAIVSPVKKVQKAEECILISVTTVKNIGFEELGASYGSATLYEQDDRSIDDMMKMADIRMYQNKVDNRKQVNGII